MWGDTMEVHVVFEIRDIPTKDHLASLREDAARLADDPAAIEVEHEPLENRHRLVARFTMPKAAQYKVVDDIARRFKMGFACEHDYLDMYIHFPPERRPRPRRRSGT